MAKFNVTRVNQLGFLHHMSMDEVQQSLAWALSSLGHDVSVTFDWFSEQQETNIILCPEFIADFQRLPRNTILYLLEQPGHPYESKVERLIKESGCSVWHYSAKGVQEWKEKGIERITHVPIGWTPNLCRIPKANQDIDVAFFGWMTERRRSLIAALTESGLKVKTSAACYGGSRDELISRTKVCLNVHHDGRDRFEIVRCSYLMANGKAVISELSSDDHEYEDLEGGLVRAPYRSIIEWCHSLVKLPSERMSLEEKAISRIQKRPYAESVKCALDTLTPTPAPAISRPLQFRQERKVAQEKYISQAKQISPIHVQVRYEKALHEGDMKDFVKWLRWGAYGNILEIGVRDGASTSALLMGLDDKNEGSLTSLDIVDCSNLFSHPRWTFNQMDSRNLKPVGIFRYDMILIDGDHSREGYRSDLEKSWELIKPGGMIMSHDIRPEHTFEELGGDWPSIAVGEEFDAFCAKHNCKFEILNGYSGMGVIYKPETVDSDESWEASKAILEVPSERT